mgnify:CR=1 FL=1
MTLSARTLKRLAETAVSGAADSALTALGAPELAPMGDDGEQRLALIFGSEESGLTREEAAVAQEGRLGERSFAGAILQQSVRACARVFG